MKYLAYIPQLSDDQMAAALYLSKIALVVRKRKRRPTCRGYGVVGDIACTDCAAGYSEWTRAHTRLVRAVLETGSK